MGCSLKSAVKMRLRQRFSQRTFLSPDDYLIAAGLLCTLALEAIIMFEVTGDPPGNDKRSVPKRRVSA
ncbi:hypothetical protein P8C59_007536 [Phyllachora maydis]|uniref:Uncharacterized protein n=1 Tax=Phyllachora maydis TaxID=1825666 RepID=A0AAD9I8Z1_9PEZI|nr:hypothetical protein P8C59_007536 [Phyllachora maydis]